MRAVLGSCDSGSLAEGVVYEAIRTFARTTRRKQNLTLILGGRGGPYLKAFAHLLQHGTLPPGRGSLTAAPTRTVDEEEAAVVSACIDLATTASHASQRFA